MLGENKGKKTANSGENTFQTPETRCASAKRKGSQRNCWKRKKTSTERSLGIKFCGAATILKGTPRGTRVREGGLKKKA